MALSRYGVEYVDDRRRTGRFIPTMHRLSGTSVSEDPYYQKAIELADDPSEYVQKAEEIEKIRLGIYEKAQKQPPYDVFICYKQSDEQGRPTQESFFAQDIYFALKEKGYRVFFANKCLNVGEQYEPQIFHALETARRDPARKPLARGGYKKGSDGAYYAKGKDGDYYKIEPIKWRILDEGKGLILAENILDAQIFDGSKNNYANSNIRKWLNGTFYERAFNEKQKGIIQVTDVDNSERSTNPNNEPTRWNNGKNEYACENTKDKVFLLSQQEVTNKAYGFAEDTLKSDDVRVKRSTGYAVSRGSLSGTGYWWLRSPYYNDSVSARYVNTDGGASNDYFVYRTDYGVVPALVIRLS